MMKKKLALLAMAIGVSSLMMASEVVKSPDGRVLVNLDVKDGQPC